MTNTKLQLRFGSQSHGWLSVYLVIDGHEHEVVASHIPNDGIRELVGAGIAAFRGVSAEVSWSLEPGFETWHIEECGDALVFRGAERVCTFQRAAFAHLVWRAVRELESRWRAEH